MGGMAASPRAIKQYYEKLKTTKTITMYSTIVAIIEKKKTATIYNKISITLLID